MTKSRKHYTLNAKQLHTLKLIYKFRFISAPLLAKYKNLSSRGSMYTTLEILADQGYLAKRIDKNIAFQNKGARYYLAPEGLKVLRDTKTLSEKALHAMYKNKTVAEEFVVHHIATIKVYLKLRDSYPGLFYLFTRSELFDYDELPEPKPDIYLNSIASGKDSKEFILYIYSDKQLYVIKKDFDSILEHFDSGDWEGGDSADYPTVLMVCADSRVEDRVRQYIDTKLDNAGIDELRILTTTTKGLLNSNIENRAVWSDVTETEELLSLLKK